MPSGIYKRKPLSEETKIKISKAQKGKPRPAQSVLNMKGKKKSKPSYGMKGKSHSEDTKSRISKGMLGVKNRLGSKHPIDCKHCEMMRNREPWNKGKKNPKICGENNPNWKGGTTSKNQLIRSSIEYKLWRTAVFERDNYTCIWCGQTGKTIQADHIKSFAFYPELRFAIDNGRTLCKECHKTTETYLNNKKL